MARIALSGTNGAGKFALVDDADLEWLSAWSWHLAPNGYAARGGSTGGRALMHRQILGLEPGDGKQGDHINRDRLDNRRENLRVVTAAENSRNTGARPSRSDLPYSPHRGVSWSRSKRKWRASAVLDRKQHHLGYFRDEAMAAESVVDFWNAVAAS